MILYFDSSAFVKLLLREKGSDQVRMLWNLGDHVVTSWIALAETGAALGAAVRAGRITARQRRTRLAHLAEDWQAVNAVVVGGAVTERAVELATVHALRGMDAVHLATALLLRPTQPVVVTWDVDLAGAARAEGLAVAGAV